MATRARRRRKDQPWNPPSTGPDITTVFVLFAAGPLLLPVVGANADAIAFAVAAVVTAYAAVRCFGASRRTEERRHVWLALAVGAAIATLAALAGVGTIVGVPAEVAFELGALAAVALLVGTVKLAHQSLRGVPLERALDALLLGLVVMGTGLFFVVLPGFAAGHAVLTGVFLIDLVAVLAASLAMVASGGAWRRMTAALLGACGTIAVADALVALSAAGELSVPAWAGGGLWTLGAIFLAAAGALESGRHAEPVAELADARWVYVRVLAPLLAVLAFPVMGLLVWLDGGIERWETAYFSFGFAVLLFLAFGRQARLLIENRTAMTRERGLREEVMRRNEDLEALTELATTMTQTLEELPIVERGVEVLHLAARATSSALQDGTRLVACAGDWQRERTWLDHVPAPGDEPLTLCRGGRDIVRLPLVARGSRIGVVTLLRPESQRFSRGEVDLLRVLADQLAIAIQNARDYRDKLEQAVRDPLTGLYNRRFFFEALDKEVQRARRYGSHASLIIFDVDDFKWINDTLGHAAGDEALRGIAREVNELIRDVDSFARIGGEEFALLLPQTQQLDALLVADRVRTGIARAEILPGRRVTISGGVSSCPHDADTREQLERRADAALYWAKRNGKNICALASEATEHALETDTEGMLAHLTALVAAIDDSRLGSRDHAQNVAAYAVSIAQELGFDADRIMRLRRAALLHDVGKIGVPTAILDKPGALDPLERVQVHLHASMGEAMLRHAGLVEEADWVRAHHERVDGGGYPDGLAGEAIPLEARILHVADAFDAMTSDRPYRAGVAVIEALVELRVCAGTQFDADVVQHFAGLIERSEIEVLALRTSGGSR